MTTDTYARETVSADISVPPTNPWGLTAAQATTLEALCLTDSATAAADLLGLKARTVENHKAAAAKRMGCAGYHRPILMWDRFVREGGAV